MTINVGIFLFPEIEVLDFAGPYEVFTTATRVGARLHSESPPSFSVFSIAETGSTVTARAGLKFIPDFTFEQHPAIDVLIIPGGVVNSEVEKLSVMDWIAQSASTAKITASVCTGAFLLAQSGVITSQKVTTHWEDIADLQQTFPSLNVVNNVRWLDEDAVVTSAGISAGIDMSLHLVSRLAGMRLAEATARQMEFEWTRNIE